MTESTHNGETNHTPEHEPLYQGEVEVFYEDGQNFIVLDTAEPMQNSVSLPTGRYHFESFELNDGVKLTPADLSPIQSIADLAQGFQPFNELGGSALLHTSDYIEEMKFLEITRPLVVNNNFGTLAGLETIRKKIENVELGRIPESRSQLLELINIKNNSCLWIRLEAVYNPDKALVGKAIFAQLADFAYVEEKAAIAPLIYSMEQKQKHPVPIPQQLSVHENWLYAEFSIDSIEED